MKARSISYMALSRVILDVITQQQAGIEQIILVRLYM